MNSSPSAEEGTPVPPPTPEEQIGVAEKLKALRASVADTAQSTEDHRRDLARHFEIVHDIERTMPGLIDMGFKLCGQLQQFSTARGIDPRRAALGTVYWTPQGDVAFDVTYDPFDISPKEPPAFVQRGFAHLKDMAAKYPAVFELLITLGHALAGEVRARGVKRFKRELQFTGLHSFENPNTGAQMWAFKIIDRGALKHDARASM